VRKRKRPGEVCCVGCFDEPEIKNFIESFDTIGNCDYCGTKRTNVADISEVAQFIRKGVERVYEDAVHSVGWDSAEGGYQLATRDMQDILEGLGVFSDKLDDPTELLRDFGFFDGTPYVRKDPYGPLSGGEEEIQRWEQFCEQVKYNQRFTILLRPPHLDRWEENEHPSVFIRDMVSWMHQELGNLISPGTTIFRARRLKANEKLAHADMTSPPSSMAGNNRMSPAGVSFFYGALDRDTAIAEVRPSLAEEVAVGSFQVCKNLHDLDFSQIPGPTSPFREDYGFHFEVFTRPFLEEFAEDISKLIRADDAVIDYVPTQVFTECIRFWSIEGSQPPDGIIFNSSMRTDGKCVVLFKGPEISSEADCQTSGAWLRYTGYSVHKITGVNLEHTLLDEPGES
jgi:hypothetical protein